MLDKNGDVIRMTKAERRKLIEEKTGITTMVAEDPLSAVAIGTGKFIELANSQED